MLLVVLLATPFLSSAAERTQLRIGTGGENGTYYPIGSLIAKAITNRSLANRDVRGILPIVQRSTGSQANIADIGLSLIHISEPTRPY